MRNAAERKTSRPALGLDFVLIVRRPFARLIAALLLAVHLTGCYNWHTPTISPAQIIADEQPAKVRVTQTDGTRLTLDDPTIQNDSIRGRSGPGIIFSLFAPSSSVALSDVSTIEVRRLSAGKTPGAVVGVPLLAWGAVVLIFAVCGFGKEC